MPASPAPLGPAVPRNSRVVALVGSQAVAAASAAYQAVDNRGAPPAHKRLARRSSQVGASAAWPHSYKGWAAAAAVGHRLAAPHRYHKVSQVATSALSDSSTSVGCYSHTAFRDHSSPRLCSYYRGSWEGQAAAHPPQQAALAIPSRAVAWAAPAYRLDRRTSWQDTAPAHMATPPRSQASRGQ